MFENNVNCFHLLHCLYFGNNYIIMMMVMVMVMVVVMMMMMMMVVVVVVVVVVILTGHITSQSCHLAFSWWCFGQPNYFWGNYFGLSCVLG